MIGLNLEWIIAEMLGDIPEAFFEGISEAIHSGLPNWCSNSDKTAVEIPGGTHERISVGIPEESHVGIYKGIPCRKVKKSQVEFS